MSELKDHRFCECDEIFYEYRGQLSNEMRPYYLKSEADKVIAEKDKDIQRLENLCESYRIDCDNLAIREANACKEIERDNKQIRHHKYKRCLAMANICCEKKENCYNRALRKYSKDEADYLASKSEFCQDWEFRWFKISEKFKEGV